MKIKNFLRKGTAVICAAVLVCGFVLPAFSSLAGTNEVDITTSTTMGNAHTGWQDGCWTVFIDPGDYTIASADLADGTSSYFYINNHESVNNVDMAEYVLINGMSVREHINSYTGSRGSGFPMNIGAVYNPILMDTFQPYDSIRVSVLSDYIAMSELNEVTLKAGFNWRNQSGETLKVTKDVTYKYAADGTATRKVEEIKKIGWKDFGVTAETTYKDTMTALSYDGTTLDNTEFEGDITFSACSELRYGGAGEWLGLQLSVDNSGRFRIVEGTYAVETIGGWSWPENPYNERVFTPADLGITEYDSLIGKRITLKIKMEEVTDTTAKVTIHINDKVVGGSFRMTSKDANTFKTGKVVGMCGNAYGAYNPITVHVEAAPPIVEPELTKITWKDFGVTTETTYKDTLTALSYDGTSLDNTEFEGDITFSACSELRYGGSGEWLGLQLSVDNSGRFRILEGTYALEPIGGWSWPENPYNERVFTPADLGITEYDSFAGQRITLNIKMEEVTETTAKVTISINDKVVGGSFRMTSKDANTYKTGTAVGMCGNAYGAYNPITAHVEAEPPIVTDPEQFPEGFVELTHLKFGIDNGEYEVTNGILAATGEVTDRSSFDKTYLHVPEITFTGDADLNFFGFSGWEGFKLRSTGADGTLALTSGWGQLLPAVIMNSEKAGVNLVGGTYDLKVTIEYTSETTLSLGVWFNDALYDNAYITVDLANKGADNVGMYMGLSSYNDNGGRIKLEGAEKPPKPTEPITPPTNLQKITLADFGGNIESKTLTADGLMSGELKNLNSYKDVLFDADVDFSTATPGDNTYIRFGGALEGWVGLSIQTRMDGSMALIDCKDNRLLMSFQTNTAGVNFYEKKFNLKVSFEYVDSDSDGEKDDLKLGVYFNNRLYDNEYVVVKDRVADMTKWLLIYTDDIVAHPLTIRLPGEKDPEPIQPDAGLKIITFSSFGIEDADFTNIDTGNFCASGLYRDMIKGKTLDGTLFHGKVKFSTAYGADIRLGGVKDGWTGIRLATTGDGCLILEDTAIENKKLSKILVPTVAGSTLTGEWLDLMMSIQYVDNDGDGKKDDVKLGIWLNSVLYENQYIYIDDYTECLGSYMGIYSSNANSHISIRSIEIETYIDLALFGFDDNYASRFKTTGDYYVAGKPHGVTEAPFTGEKRSSAFWYIPAALLGMILCVCMRRYKKYQ